MCTNNNTKNVDQNEANCLVKFLTYVFRGSSKKPALNLYRITSECGPFRAYFFSFFYHLRQKKEPHRTSNTWGKHPSAEVDTCILCKNFNRCCSTNRKREREKKPQKCGNFPSVRMRARVCARSALKLLVCARRIMRRLPCWIKERREKNAVLEPRERAGIYALRKTRFFPSDEDRRRSRSLVHTLWLGDSTKLHITNAKNDAYWLNSY